MQTNHLLVHTAVTSHSSVLFHSSVLQLSVVFPCHLGTTRQFLIFLPRPVFYQSLAISQRLCKADRPMTPTVDCCQIVSIHSLKWSVNKVTSTIVPLSHCGDSACPAALPGRDRLFHRHAGSWGIKKIHPPHNPPRGTRQPGMGWALVGRW